MPKEMQRIADVNKYESYRPHALTYVGLTPNIIRCVQNTIGIKIPSSVLNVHVQIDIGHSTVMRFFVF